MAILADFMLVWLPAPTVGLSPALAKSASGFAKFLAACPDNAFQVSPTQTPPPDIEKKTQEKKIKKIDKQKLFSSHHYSDARSECVITILRTHRIVLLYPDIRILLPQVPLRGTYYSLLQRSACIAVNPPPPHPSLFPSPTTGSVVHSSNPIVLLHIHSTVGDLL